jgi:ferrous iron transport protein B
MNLALQILEITDRAVLCLNLMDEARRRGIRVNHRTLERDLGVPVVPTVARTAHGMTELIAKVADVASGRITTEPHRIRAAGAVAQALDELALEVEAAYPGLPNARWVAMRLLEGDRRVEDAIRRGEFAEQLAPPAPVPAGAEDAA